MSKHLDFHPDVHEAGARVSVGGVWRVWVLTQALRLGLAALVAGPFVCGSPAESGRDLPRHARLRIETSGGIVTGLAYAPDGSHLVSGDYITGRIATWDAASGRPLGSLESRRHTRHVRSLALAPDGRSFAAYLLGHAITLGDLTAGEPMPRLPDIASPSAPAFTPDGRRLIAAGTDRTIRVLDTATWREQWSWPIPGAEVRCLAVGPDGRTLATGGGDGRIRCWDLASGRLLRTIPGAAARIDSVAFSPDGLTLISGGDGRFQLWDTRTFQARLHLPGRSSSPILCQAYSPDGRYLATGQCDHVVRLWDPATGTLQQSLSGHQQAVQSLAFAPDGRTLASGAGDGNILLWELPAHMPPGPDR